MHSLRSAGGGESGKSKVMLWVFVRKHTLPEKQSCAIRQQQRLFRDFSEFSVCAQRNVLLACGVNSACACPSLPRLALRPTPVFVWLPNAFTGLPVSNGDAAEKGLGGASIDTRLLLCVCSYFYSGHSLCCAYGFYCLVLHFIFFPAYFFFVSHSWILLCCGAFHSIV